MSGETKIYELLAVGGEVHKYLVRAKAYERVRDWILRKEAYPILILGASGVGKTSLIKSLCNEPAYIRRQDRTEESHSVVRKIDSSYLKLIDTPGEQLHEARRKVAIREGQRSSIGIINVVCFGYHEGVRGASEAVNDGMPSTDYLERQRLVEIERLSEWASILCGKVGSASWITTVCTKADLWWTVSEEQPVLDYYRSHSDYANRMSQDGFPPHAVKSYSSINNLFFGQAKMSGYYSDRLRGEDRSSLIAHLLDSNCSRPFGHAGIGRGMPARVRRMASRARRERRRAVSTTERMSA